MLFTSFTEGEEKGRHESNANGRDLVCLRSGEGWLPGRMTCAVTQAQGAQGTYTWLMLCFNVAILKFIIFEQKTLHFLRALGSAN